MFGVSEQSDTSPILLKHFCFPIANRSKLSLTAVSCIKHDSIIYGLWKVLQTWRSLTTREKQMLCPSSRKGQKDKLGNCKNQRKIMIFSEDKCLALSQGRPLQQPRPRAPATGLSSRWGLLGCIGRNTAFVPRKGVIHHFSALDTASSLGHTSAQKVDILEWAQQSARLAGGWALVLWGEAEGLGLVSLEKRQLCQGPKSSPSTYVEVSKS